MPSMTETATPNAVPLQSRPSWMASAACRDVPTAVFFDEATEPAAIRCCAGCAVRSTCLAYALAAREPDGVWGAMTARRRHRVIERSENDGIDRRPPGPARSLTDTQLRQIFATADPNRAAMPQLREQVGLSSAGAYLYVARASALGLVERRGRLIYPARY